MKKKNIKDNKEKEEKQKLEKLKKLKLLPSLREKRHYLVLIINDKKLNNKKIKEIINKAILNFIGVLGYAKAGPLFVEMGQTGKRKTDENFYVILSVTTKHVDVVRASLALTNVKCIGVSGTIKKAKEKFLRI